MTIQRTICSLLLLGTLYSASSNAALIINDNGFAFGDTWDNPGDEVSQVLNNLESEIGSGETLTLINNAAGGLSQTFSGLGATSIILEEIAGYETRTTFGWYDAANTSINGEIFSGSDSNGASADITFTSLTEFGFYIDPNGIGGNRMFTENSLNDWNNHQVAIFEVGGLENTFILGWEDLPLGEYANGGDRDYQDMILRVKINTASVPEPTSVGLFVLAVLGLVVTRKLPSEHGNQ